MRISWIKDLLEPSRLALKLLLSHALNGLLHLKTLALDRSPHHRNLILELVRDFTSSRSTAWPRI